MSFIKRLKNIIISNINSGNNKTDYFNIGDFQKFANSDDFEYSSINCDNQPSGKFKNSQEAEYYANLELAYGASFSEIKTAYRKLLKKYHPDRFYNNEKKLQLAQEVVTKLNLAYNYFEKNLTKKSKD